MSIRIRVGYAPSSRIGSLGALHWSRTRLDKGYKDPMDNASHRFFFTRVKSVFMLVRK